MSFLIMMAIALALYLYLKLDSLRQQVLTLQQRVQRLEQTEPLAWDLSGVPASPPEAETSAPLPVIPLLPEQAMHPHHAGRPHHIQEPRPTVAAPKPGETRPPAVPERDMESLLGTGWLTRLGVIAIVLAVAFLLQYAFARIGPAVKTGIGLGIGLALYGLGQFLIRKPVYRNYGQIVSAGGIVTFFVSVYAAHNLFHLVGYWGAFAGLAVPALLATLLAVRADAQGLAVFCILGAFSAPVILQTGQGVPDSAGLYRLYGYMLFLNVWAAGMLKLKPWFSLPVAALASTWVLFFTAGPLRQTGWALEGFAALFLAVTIAIGVLALYEDERPGDEGAMGSIRAADLGVGIILAGLVAFSIASAQILEQSALFGWPAVMSVGLFVAVLATSLASMSAGLPHAGERSCRPLAYASVGAIVLLLGIGSFTARPIPTQDFPGAFAFTVISLVIFLAAAVMMARRKNGSEPASAVVAGAAIVHANMAYHALQGTLFLSTAGAVAWLPMAGWLVLITVLFVQMGMERGRFLSAVAVSAAGLTVAALFAAIASDRPYLAEWRSDSATLLILEFLAISGTWIALRNGLRLESFRGDLVGAFANGAVFFALLWPTAGDARLGGVETRSAYALLLAAYHAAIGLILLRKDDPLHRYVYLGLAVTFLTIAVPLQFREASITTLAWSVEGLALLWTGLRLKNDTTRACGLGVISLAAGKALLFDISRTIDPFQFLLNSRMMAGVSVITACYIAAWMLWRRRADLLDAEQTAIPALLTTANGFTLLFMSVDLWQFADRTWPAEGHSAAQLALSLFWTVYALGGVIVGMWKRVKPVRLFAMGLLYLSICKVFLFDLSGLEQPYRIVSFFTLGVILLLISLLYTRFEEWLKDFEHPGGMGKMAHNTPS